MNAHDLRRRYKVYWREVARVDALRRDIMTDEKAAERRAGFFVDHGYWPPPPILPSWPEYPKECIDMVCGAWGRQKGRPCQCTQIYSNGRCRFHGGLSTGPKTAEGKASSLANLPRLKPHGGAEKN